MNRMVEFLDEMRVESSRLAENAGYLLKESKGASSNMRATFLYHDCLVVQRSVNAFIEALRAAGEEL